MHNLEIETMLKHADVEKDFKLFYQPQYSLPDLKLIGAEALIRWENREYGYIPAAVFISIAEEFDYIFKIGRWVMSETIRQTKEWNTSYPMNIKVGFNVSPKQLGDTGFITQLEALLASEELDPRRLDAEITENVMFKDGSRVKKVFEKLKKMGVSISVDDFGSGYSTLSYLSKYPFDRAKLDKTLIECLSTDGASAKNIVKAAIDIAHSAGIQALAEGVEKTEQLEILKELGCDQVQGFLLGRPVPPDVFEQLYLKVIAPEAYR
jgi:EAL domain-containing protein (putative c-di-GMP-specific phosphodiesterase class I)